MRRRVKCRTLLRIHFQTANQKNSNFFQLPELHETQFKNNRGALGTRMGYSRLIIKQSRK